jgi:MFS transporter, ACS family, hexuronate transporter
VNAPVTRSATVDRPESTTAIDVYPATRLGRYRWVICFLLFVITVDNYMDRQLLSIAAPVLAAEYHFSNTDIALIANAFLVAYTVGQLFAGLFVDRIGARRGMTIAVVVWSVVTGLMAFGRSVTHFGIFRFLLGLSESVNFPAGTKVCAEWFPPNERATAVGFFQSGSAVGAMLTPAVAAYMITRFGWQAAFIILAIPGFIWLPFWLRSYRTVETHPRLSEQERVYITAHRGEQAAPASEQKVRWSFFLRHRLVLAVAAARFLEEPSGWFYFTWLPIYLKDHRDVSLINIGFLLIIPFLTFDIGKVGGGWLSSLFMKRGWTLDRARKVVMLGSALCMAASIPAMLASTPLGFVLLISIATLGHGSWATTTQTIPGDIVAPRFVGTVYGITAFGGGIGAIIFTFVTGKLVDLYGSFTVPFVIAGILPLIGYWVFALLAREIKPIQFDPQSEEAVV